MSLTSARRRANARESVSSIDNTDLSRSPGLRDAGQHGGLSMRQIVTFIRRKIPSLSTLAIGICFGLLIARWFNSGETATTKWRGGAATPSWMHSAVSGGSSQSSTISPPTLEQRLRVFNVLSTMPGHHTKDCTRTVQPTYKRQVYERYEPLVGYARKSRRRSLTAFMKKLVASRQSTESEEIERIFKSDRRSTGTTKNRQPGQYDPKQPKEERNFQDGHKYFFAINLYNSFDVIPDLFSTMFKVSAILGFQNVFVSVYENGSKDQTKALLKLFDALARSVGLRVLIRTSLRTRGAFNHRIEYLAEVRNAALAPLQELRDATGETFDTVIFQNDVLPCVDDVLELIWQSRRQNAGITCGADYIYHEAIGQPVFYDNWVSRDMNGTALENAPFEAVFRDGDSSHRFQRHLPIQVQSCWNGIAILDPAPLYAHPHVKFRMARLEDGECSASECSLICNDYWEAGYGRIMMVPRVKLAYDKQVWDVIHPNRRNLTIIRGYTRLGGAADDPHSDPQDRSWFGPHDRLFRPEESELVNFKSPPPYVWCWGWDGAGDIEGPDVEPVWEPLKNYSGDARLVRHDRSWQDY